MERKASIHIQPVKGNSEQHNLRQDKPYYLIENNKEIINLKENQINSFLLRSNIGSFDEDKDKFKNLSWIKEHIGNAERRIEALYKASTGQKMQKKATPIREGVINLPANLSTDKCFKRINNLKDDLERKFGIKTIQIHIHQDEGYIAENGKKMINSHAHLVFDWTDEKGKSLKLGKEEFSIIQDITAKCMEMERGIKKHISKRRRYTHWEFRDYHQIKNDLKQELKQEIELSRVIEKKEEIQLENKIKYILPKEENKFLNPKMKNYLDKMLEEQRRLKEQKLEQKKKKGFGFEM